MRLFPFGFAMALLAGAPTHAQTRAPLDPAPRIGTVPTTQDRYPERRIPFANGVTGLPDQVYVQLTGFRPQTLDVYLPAETMTPPAGGFPLVMYVHGGGWSSGDARKGGAIYDLPGLFASLAAKGYVVASLNYRLSGEAPFPAAEKDVKLAIRWLRARAAQYRMDPARAVAWGGSAGGHLAGLAAVSCGVAELDPLAPAAGQGSRPAPAAEPGRAGIAASSPPVNPLAGVSDCLQGAVAWYGIFDFATLPAGGAPNAFLGCVAGTDCSAAVKAASPVTYVDRSDPPMLLIHGTEDRTVPIAQSTEMEAKLKAAGVPVTFIAMPAVDHSLIGKTPDATRDTTLKALAATFDFFDRTIGPRRPR